MSGYMKKDNKQIKLLDGLFNTKILGTKVIGKLQPYEAPADIRCVNCFETIKNGDEVWTREPKRLMDYSCNDSEAYCVRCAIMDELKTIRKFPRLVVKDKNLVNEDE